MSDRHNDRVRVSLSRGDVVLPWASRQELLNQLRRITWARPISEAFEAVGVSPTVSLSREQKGLLLAAIELWGAQAPGGLKALPEGIFKLRNRLHDDLN